MTKVNKVQSGLYRLAMAFPKATVSAQSNLIIFGKVTEKQYKYFEEHDPYSYRYIKEWGWRYYKRCRAFLKEV